jgi:hypothetical protein
MKGRFLYPLQPLLLTRQWDLDALLVELGEQNAALAATSAAIAELRAKLAQAGAEWERQRAGGALLPVAQFAMFTRFMGQLGGQLREREAALAEQNAARDALVERMAQSQRALEAVEEHRDGELARFIQARLSGDFKLADDQWNTLQQGTANNGN